jgi:hypothetical protein
MAFLKLTDPLGIDVVADGFEFFCESGCQWKAYVSEADDGEFAFVKRGKHGKKLFNRLIDELGN